MAANQLIAPLPPDDLTTGCTVTFEAIDPASGSAVTGVTVSLAALQVYNTNPEEHAPEPVLPLFVPIPDTQDEEAA